MIEVNGNKTAVVFGKGSLMLGKGITITPDNKFAAEIVALHIDGASAINIHDFDFNIAYVKDSSVAVRLVFENPDQIEQLIEILENAKWDLQDAVQEGIK